MAISDYGNVVSFPIEKRLAMYPEVDFVYEMDPPDGHSVTATDLVFMRVLDPLSMKLYDTWNAANDVENNKYKWRVPFADTNYVQHGARYRIYLQFGLPDTRVFHQTGVLVWKGR